jgi:phosphoglycerate kinase
LASLGDAYVNDAFGTSHREHASFISLPSRMPRAAGEHLRKEVEQLSRVLENPERPLVALLSGVKEDKLTYLERFVEISDLVLVGGRLPVFMDEDYKHDKVFVSRLLQDKEDITLHSVEKMEEEVAKAKTILVSGPMGKFEEEGHRLGTKRVFEAIANSEAYKVAGGGDTEAAITLLGLEDKFDWISTGGGAMLEFIAKGTLPGLQALLD